MVGVPVGHANGLDGIVGEGDGRAWNYLNDFLEVFPVVGCLVGTFGTNRHIESGIFVVVENTKSNRYWCWIFYGDGGQARAVLESIIPYTRHAAGDIDGGQARAATKSTIPYARHAFRDGDGGQAGAASVFANYFISVICKLNGRKVMLWILCGIKKT